MSEFSLQWMYELWIDSTNKEECFSYRQYFSDLKRNNTSVEQFLMILLVYVKPNWLEMPAFILFWRSLLGFSNASNSLSKLFRPS